ncbi:RNA polymerase sigma factor [Mesorhizobium sp. M0276]|uniref:RNA polymerase sigma factor n=1 Tax=Mesorhizobium sp. M0276 TaxID=2956928 RepID=UPI003337EF9C
MWQLKDMPGRSIGLFDARYRAFLETVSGVRAQLHRYCTRMTGSRLDGEDLMQETLFEAYTKIETLDDPRRLKPWLFRIAHNRCIDFLRRRDVRERAEQPIRTTSALSLQSRQRPMHAAPSNGWLAACRPRSAPASY